MISRPFSVSGRLGSNLAVANELAGRTKNWEQGLAPPFINRGHKEDEEMNYDR